MTRGNHAGLALIYSMGAVATAALALLTLGCVFAATAGPREALATRTQALRQTLDAAPPLAQTLVASAQWDGVTSNIGAAGYGAVRNRNLTAGQLDEMTGQLRADFDRGVVRLAPPGADWAAMTSNPHLVSSSLPAAGGLAVRLEVSYRQPVTQYMRLVAGHFPPSSGTNAAGSPAVTQPLQVMVSPQTARQFGLHPGSKVRITGPQISLSGTLAAITLEVTGIVVPRDPSSTFWTTDPTVLTPDLQTPSNAPSYWVGGVFAGPGEIDAVQRDFGPEGLAMQWTFPLVFGSLNGQQAQPLYNALNRLSAQSPALSGDLAPASGALQVSTGMLQPLGAFLATADAVDTLLWLLYVSLAVAGLAVLLLAARMVVMRRSAELAVRRARGASLWQLALTTARGAALACVPAGLAAVVIAVLVVPGPMPAGGGWPPAVVLLVAVCAPAVVAAWQHRLPRRRQHGRRRPWARARLVAEATACLAAIAGIAVFRQQGTQPGAGVNLYTSAAPVLVAVPAVIVVLRAYPVVLRGLLRGSARSAGATAFLGLARAARTALTPALPAFTLVLALSVAAFAGMVRDAVTRGEVAASWQAAGADATVVASTQNTPGVTLDPAALRAAAAAPGVTHAAAVWQASWVTADSQQITGIVVDPASYAALVAATQTFPRLPARLLEAGTAGTPQPVLASPRAAAELGHGTTTLTPPAAIAPVRVRVAGVLSGTPALPALPAQPGSGAFVIMPLSAMHNTATPPAPVPINELLLTGAGIDRARLAAVVRDMVPGGAATFRSDVLNGLSTAPLQHGTFAAFALAVAAAAGLGLAVMLLELALGAAERESTLARLATMGLGEGQRARMVLLEVLPAVAAAAVAAWACAVVLPRLVAPAIDLSVFTDSLVAVALTPDVASVALPLAGLVALALLALAIEIRSGRRRRVTASLRAGG